jgi:glycosyltransferase involved in cell wall biosynthesis
MLEHVADFYISISRQMERYLAELGISSDRITYLPNGVNTKLFHPKREKEDNLLLFVGRITYIKGLHVLLKSLRYLRKRIHLVVIGPSDWDVEYFSEILARIQNENKKGIHKITYLGEQGQANIIEWYQKASIFVLPSSREAFPAVNLEALACGTPVVATNIGGTPEIIQHGRNGLLVPPNNAIKLAEEIQYLLDNREIRTRFGEIGREVVMESFSLEIVAKKLSSIYERIVSHNS